MCNIDFSAGYLAAMIDGEGWIGEPKSLMNRAIRIANTDPIIIEAIKAVCDELGITYTVQQIRARSEKRSPGWVVDITGRENMVRIRDTVPFRCRRKRERLDKTIASYRSPLPINRDELARLYTVEGLTQEEVAARLGVGYKRVKLAMQAYGIARRLGSDRNQSVWRTRRAKYGDRGRH